MERGRVRRMTDYKRHCGNGYRQEGKESKNPKNVEIRYLERERTSGRASSKERRLSLEVGKRVEKRFEINTHPSMFFFRTSRWAIKIT